jgi:hypothetical protein
MLLLAIRLIFLLGFERLGAGVEALTNANHIFNAIHSSMRQWGSSLNHNGMSFFLATVPKGTHLHHGRGDDTGVQGMEWLAFEPEHALNFAWRIYECDDPGATTATEQSLKWSLAAHLQSLISDRGGNPIIAPSQHALRPPDRPPLNICLDPGYLHTFAPSRELRLLYIDGQSAAKSLNGTLDSQDCVLRHDCDQMAVFDDYRRALDLCSIAREKWLEKIDGFIRMEHGFEIVLCDFSVLDVVSVLQAEHPVAPGHNNRDGGAENWLNFFSAITSRYSGIGGERAKLYYEKFVTAFEYPELGLFESGSGFPRLKDISQRRAKGIFDEVTSLVLSTPPIEGTNWQAITTLLTTRYAPHLQRLAMPGMFANSSDLRLSVRLLLAPYISHSQPNPGEEVNRCTTALIPYYLKTTPPRSQVLSQKAFTSVSHRVCSTLHDIMTESSSSLEEQQSQIRILVDWLDWSDFRYCLNPSCEIGEVCFTAIWPFGTIQDIEKPNCRNGSRLTLEMGDWDMDIHKAF